MDTICDGTTNRPLILVVIVESKRPLRRRTARNIGRTFQAVSERSRWRERRFLTPTASTIPSSERGWIQPFLAVAELHGYRGDVVPILRKKVEPPGLARTAAIRLLLRLPPDGGLAIATKITRLRVRGDATHDPHHHVDRLLLHLRKPHHWPASGVGAVDKTASEKFTHAALRAVDVIKPKRLERRRDAMAVIFEAWRAAVLAGLAAC